MVGGSCGGIDAKPLCIFNRKHAEPSPGPVPKVQEFFSAHSLEIRLKMLAGQDLLAGSVELRVSDFHIRLSMFDRTR